jgi:glycosyltransferase involved in cell wall biosynthesis
MKKIAILTSGILPVPAVQGGAVENLIDFYLEYNNEHRLYDITVYSIQNAKTTGHPALASDVNHYVYIDVNSFIAKLSKIIYGLLHRNEYYNHFIEYYFEQAYKHLRKERYDCIILENRPGYAYKLSQRGHKNLILHLHNELLHSESRDHDVIFNGLTSILTVSDYIKSRVATIQPSDKIKTVHNGINLNNFNTQKVCAISRKDVGFTNDDFVMVFSGRINKDKGVSELIDAMYLLKCHPNIKLMIIGGSFFGNTNNEDEFILQLKKKAKAIQERIIFTGFIPYDQMPDYLQIADIAVIPSIWNDPFPTTELEAQAMGLPIITTRQGGIPEEVSEENAILLETGNHFVDNLAKAILNLYEHSEKRQLMSKVSLKRSKQFDKKTYAKNFFAALEGM